MTGIFIALGLAVAAVLGILFGARIGRKGWEPVAAAVLFGVAGYAWQGQPSLAGSPVSANNERKVAFDEALVERRRSMGERLGPATKWLVISDGLARQGQTQDAANILVTGLRSDPRNPDLWVGLGNALVLHGEGVLSPAAEFAYQQALTFNPKSPSARYFYALALARNGKLVPARAIWTELAAELPEGTPFRAELEQNVALIDQLLARQAQSGPPAP
jgi:cytochrome c-type biogenesis protein CcmH/NrfG